MHRLAALLLALLAPGCVQLTFERERDGLPGPVREASKLEQGTATLAGALEELGPPALLVRVGEATRAYWTARDRRLFKLVIRGYAPVGGTWRSFDAFLFTLGRQTLHLARLDFDRAGKLATAPQVTSVPLGSTGYYLFPDPLIMQFIEERERDQERVGDEEERAAREREEEEEEQRERRQSGS